MMNHRGDDGFPWGNRADADAVRPLPDDVRLLRASYPASGTRWDVDATNTWYEITSTSKGGAADQVKLCTASVGTAFLYGPVSERRRAARAGRPAPVRATRSTRGTR